MPKHIKRYLYLILACSSVPLTMAMEQEDHSSKRLAPDEQKVKIEQKEGKAGSLTGLSDEIKLHIMSFLAIADTADKAIQNIKAFCLTSKAFSKLLKDPHAIKELIEEIANWYGEEPKSIARKFSEEIYEIYTCSPGKCYVVLARNAIRAGNKDLLRAFLEDGVDINTADPGGATFLHWAVHKKNGDFLEFLIECGADVNKADNEGRTPLHDASSCGYKSLVELLLQRGADVNAANMYGATPLLKACKRLFRACTSSIKDSHKDTVELLIQNGAHVNVVNKNGDTPLILATLYDYYDTVELLLKNGAHVNVANKEGNTALHYAADDGRKDIVELLIQYGAKVNVANEHGNTPLIKAAPFHEGVVELLLKAGADVNILNNHAYTALEAALWKGNSSLVKLLLDHGANVNVQNKDGLTPWEQIVSSNHPQETKTTILQLLLAKGAGLLRGLP